MNSKPIDGAGKLLGQRFKRLRKFLEANGARIGIPEDRNFETEGEAIESGLRRTVEGRATVMRTLIRAVYRFRDATLGALQIVLRPWLERPDAPIIKLILTGFHQTRELDFTRTRRSCECTTL